MLTGMLPAFLPYPAPPDQPRLLDERLQLTLFAENPDIATPIGIAIDRRDRIYVLESHTHLRPAGYSGPVGDVIKVMTDENRDGRPDRISVFAEGLKEGLNLAFSPEGTLYAVTSRAVWALPDRDGDGRCEAQEKVLELVQPASVYAHAALLGLTFSPDGWLYVSRGNTGGQAWKLVGTDGSSVSGYGDGGNIVRARPDGSRLEEVATGFWNPMDLKFDARGRLLAADNDPDSRGPNRLVHIVPGGDYGYRSLYGGSGIHPYLAWNGELPGTLPYAVPLGEAPSGLLDASQAALPTDYENELLSSIWEESRLVRIRLNDHGASVTGEAKIIAEGGEDFRPVAFATDQSGAIYFTDWVKRDYPNHGRGRIWKLTTRPGVAVNRPKPAPTALASSPLERLYAAAGPNAFDILKAALVSEDPFRRHAAVMALTQPALRQQLLLAAQDNAPAVRLGAVLALQRANHQPAEPIARRLLSDPDPGIRRQVLQWIGQAGLTALRSELDRALTAGPGSDALFETYLETLAHLSPDFQQAYKNRSAAYAKSIKRELPKGFIEGFIRDPARPGKLRALALRHLPQPEAHTAWLTRLLQTEPTPELSLELIRTLTSLPDPAVGKALLQVARAANRPAAVRAEALLALARQPDDFRAAIQPLLRDAQPDVRLEALRYLRTRLSPSEAKSALKTLPASSFAREAAYRQQLSLAFAGAQPAKPPASWETVLATGGNAERGRRVFYSVQASCASCHAVGGRGGDLGPALDNVGRSKSRQQLIQAILRPSAEISPEWQGWYIRLTNGEEHQGRQIDVGDKGIELYTQATGFVTFSKKDIKEYGLIRTSLMPDGLERQLTEHDLRDLLAFLQASR